MDISYLKDIYNISLHHRNPGLFYYDKLTDNYNPVETLHPDKYHLIHQLCLNFIQNKPSKKLYSKMISNFNIISNKNSNTFIPFKHILSRSKNDSICTRLRIIFSNFQIIMNQNMTQVLHIYYPNNHVSYIKYKKHKKNKKKCPGCHPIFQPNQLAHVGPNGCLGDEL